jgi:hypothetical protein
MNVVRVASVADEDVIRCAVWLEQQKAGLGSDFLTLLDQTFAEISLRPLACPTLVLEGVRFKFELRWLRIERFPHIVIFECHSNEILVVAVAHPHQDLETLLRSRVGVQ